MKTEEYTLPAFWASALINGDESGMNDEDIKAMNEWLERNNPGSCIACTEEPTFFNYHAASDQVLACDCLDYTFAKYPATTK